MSTPLLVTKTYLPHPRDKAVRRYGLFTRLSSSLTRKLTLISAPAGFGKTTLLSAWFELLSHPEADGSPAWEIAWLALDRNDNDPYRFWTYVIAALQTVEPGLADEVQAALLSPSPPPLPGVMSALVNAVACQDRRLLLALDDYHVIQTEAIHTSLNDLLEALPPNWRLIIATREDPPLSLARRRAQGELAELRAADLRFTLDETVELLNTCLGLELSSADINMLYRRTEGWVAGLHLAALSLQSCAPVDRQAFVSSFAGDDRFIFDYLMDEVFRHLTVKEQNFLLHASPLERLCGPLCQAVTGCEDSSMMLIDLERANLFIQPLDNRRYWYRFHPLFADLLRQRLRESEGAATCASLQLKASYWYESQGLIPEAVACVLAAPDFEYTATLLERHVLDVFYRSEIFLVYQWLKALPEVILHRHPLLCAVYANTIALVFLTPDAFEDAENWLRAAEASMAAPGATGTIPEETEAFIVKFRAYLAKLKGEPPQEVIRLSQNALSRLPSSTTRFRSALTFLIGSAYMELGEDEAAWHAFSEAQRFGEASHDWFNALVSIDVQAYLSSAHGNLRQAAAMCRQALVSLVQPLELGGKTPPSAGSIYTRLGSLLIEWNELDEAESLLRRGLELLTLTTLPEIQTDGYFSLARLKCAQGDIPDALSAIQQAEALWPHPREQLAHLKVQTWLALAGRDPQCSEAADRWVVDRRLEPGCIDRLNLEQLALARWFALRLPAPSALEHPSYPDLSGFLSQQLDIAQRRQLTGRVIEIMILEALVYQSQKRTAQAVAVFQQALMLAEPEGYLRMFVDFGVQIMPLLRLAVEKGTIQNYASRLLALLESEAVTSFESTIEARPATEKVVEPLSERELDVLHLLAEGLTNRQIAGRLHLSPNTVRIHASNIYSKLGAGNRTQAVSKARALGFLIEH